MQPKQKADWGASVAILAIPPKPEMGAGIVET